MSSTLRNVILLNVCLIALGGISRAGEWVEGRVTHVRDADTIEVKNRPIRLNGIDAPELNERGGRRARSWLTKALLRKPVRCWLNGEKTYDRWVGICYTEAEHDVGAMVISAGHARDCPRYSGGRYAKYETSESRKLPSHGYCK
jgi:micrococcal nuclease